MGEALGGVTDDAVRWSQPSREQAMYKKNFNHTLSLIMPF